jgi:hypothetical protein
VKDGVIYADGMKLRLIFAPTEIPSKSKAGYLRGRVGSKKILPHLTR